jgi:hypothetical protein
MALAAIVSALAWLLGEPVPASDDLAASHRSQRKLEYRRGAYAEVLRLVDLELAALSPGAADLRARCDAIEVGRHVCSERLPERGCEGDYLRRAETAGCLADPRERPRHHKLSAGAALRRMDLTVALRSLQSAVAAAEPLFFASVFSGDPELAEQFRDVVVDLAGITALRVEIAAHLRSRVGFEDALTTLRMFLDFLPPADAAAMRNEVAWGLLVLREAGVAAADPTALLESVLTTFASGATRDGPKADNARINLALAALQRRAQGEAADRLAGIEEVGLNPEERLWLFVVRLRLALARGDVAGAARWQAELARPEIVEHVPMGAWFSAWTRGLVFEAGGARAAAIAAYQDAEAVLEADAHASDGAAHGSSADRRYSMFSSATRRLIALLVDEQRPAEALWFARNARNRALRRHARESCPGAQRARDDSPPPGALHLLYFPREPRPHEAGSTWFGFAVTATAVHVVPLTLDALPDDPSRGSADDLRRWSEQLLAPFEWELADADSLTIFPTGALHALPFHALPWDDGLLLDAAPVRYGLDVAACDDSPAAAPGSALIVSGGDYSLPVEAGLVAAALRDGGMAVDHLSALTPAPFAALLSGQYDLAHLAAHGQHPTDEVMFAADVQLVFGDGSELKREAVLAAETVPRLVYLSACRSSFADSDTLGGGLNLAHAFLLRGARFVIGSVQDIDANATRAFARRFYRTLAAGDRDDVAEAWRSAYLETRRALEPSLQVDLRMLRLFTP